MRPLAEFRERASLSDRDNHLHHDRNEVFFLYVYFAFHHYVDHFFDRYFEGVVSRDGVFLRCDVFLHHVLHLDDLDLDHLEEDDEDLVEVKDLDRVLDGRDVAIVDAAGVHADDEQEDDEDDDRVVTACGGTALLISKSDINGTSLPRAVDRDTVVAGHGPKYLFR